MKIADNGSWLNETNEGHCFDEALAKAIVQFCTDNELQAILDLGCGDGKYVNYFGNIGKLVAIGIDGNPNTTFLAGKGAVCYQAELHTPLEFLVAIDLILSLEVGEHILAKYEDIFLDNVVKYAKNWIILSWALPDQTGDGHVNCRDNIYIIGKVYQRGFRYAGNESYRLQRASTLPWFKNSLMVFKRIT